MNCRIDVQKYLNRQVSKVVDNVGTFDESGFSYVTKNFNQDNLKQINDLNNQFSFNFLKYQYPTSSELPGYIQMNVPDVLVNHYINKYGVKKQKVEGVNYSLKAVNILSSNKAKQVFAKGEKNGWDLNKILTELAIPKEQKQIILNYKNNYVNNTFNKLEKEC